MRKIAVVMTLALAACGGSEETPKAAASSEAPPPPRYKGLKCSGYPDFVALPEDATVGTCNNGDSSARRIAGTIVFQTEMAPKDAIAFYKDLAKKSGLADGISSSNQDSQLYSANDTVAKRSIQVTTERMAAGETQVTVEWGKENWDAAPKTSG